MLTAAIIVGSASAHHVPDPYAFQWSWMVLATRLFDCAMVFLLVRFSMPTGGAE